MTDTVHPHAVSVKIRSIVFQLLKEKHTEEELAWQVLHVLEHSSKWRHASHSIDNAHLRAYIQEAVAAFKAAGRKTRTWESEGLLFA